MPSRAKPSPLKKIRSGAMARGLSLAKMTLNAGARAASHAVGSRLSSKESRPGMDQSYLLAQAKLLARELGQLKGSAMKVGQMLSMYGEHFLPAEVNETLKSLQQHSPPLAWSEIEKVLKRQLSPELLGELEIDPVAWASASLGQVHRARVRETGPFFGNELALKIQYPGVDKAIDSDLRLIHGLLSASKLVPSGHRYDSLFAEIKDMLLQEIDYTRELALTHEYGAMLSGDPRYVVPRIHARYSTAKVLASSFELGVRADDPSVKTLPLERRNEIARAMLDLYLSEVFRFGVVQTDPHFGNYLVRLKEAGGGDRDQLVLLDFGAVRKLDPPFRAPYKRMVRGAFTGDREMIAAATDEMGFTQPGDSDELRQKFAEICILMTEPFQDHAQPYRWQGTDLPQRAMKAGMELSLLFRFRPPPREIVFLDRKLGGVFIWISTLGAEFRARELLERALG